MSCDSPAMVDKRHPKWRLLDSMGKQESTQTENMPLFFLSGIAAFERDSDAGLKKKSGWISLQARENARRPDLCTRNDPKGIGIPSLPCLKRAGLPIFSGKKNWAKRRAVSS